MVPNGPIGQVLKRVFFPVEPAVLAPLTCLLQEDLVGGSFITNFHNFWTDSFLGNIIRQFFTILGLNVIFVSMIGVPWIIAFQNSSYGVHKANVDTHIHNDSLTRRLYEWTKKEVKPYSDKL